MATMLQRDEYLEMAAALSAYQHIEIKKSLFSTKAVYTPTQSQAKPLVLEYTPTEGERVALQKEPARDGIEGQTVLLPEHHQHQILRVGDAQLS